MVCPKCGSDYIQTNTFQEQVGSKTKTKTKSKYKEKKHGFLWWISVGWWWWIVDLLSWIFCFFPRLIMRIFAKPYKKSKHTEQGKTTSTTKNKIEYRTVFVCEDCGYQWTRR